MRLTRVAARLLENGSLSQVLSRLRRDKDTEAPKKPNKRQSSVGGALVKRAGVSAEQIPALIDMSQQEQLVAGYTAQMLMVRPDVCRRGFF